jgi:DNA-binding CsgD family transcriptional regulator
MAAGAVRPAEVWPLLGRQSEIDEFGRTLARAEKGSIVLVGPPGVGKTRLALEALAIAKAHGRACVQAVASRAAATIPLGALAPLLASTVNVDGGRHALIAAGLAALEAAGGDEPAVLFVDNAQLLDDASAAVVHQAAVTGVVTLVATIRTGEAVPDTVTALWKDGIAHRIDVGPLNRADVEQLVPMVLGGPVDGGALHRVWAATEGNVLFLRELVLGAMDAGLLVDEGGLWRLRGSLVASARLNELILARLADTSRAEQAVLEVLAVGEPLGLSLLVQLSDTASIEGLERRGLLVTRIDGVRQEVTLAHSLYGELLRDRMPAIAVLRINRVLADAVDALGARRREDVVRVAVWRLDGGGDANATVMLAAARLAYAGRELDAAEYLARHATDAGGGLDAGLLWSSALAELGRNEEADEVLARLGEQVVDDDERALVALRRSVHLMWSLGRVNDAKAVLDAADAAVAAGAWRDELRAQRANLRALAGRPVEALELAADLLVSPVDRVVIRASTGAAISLTACGRFDEAMKVAGRAWKRQTAADDQRAFGSAGFHIVLRTLAVVDAGRLADARSAAEEAYAVSVRSEDPVGRGWFALALARAELASGRLATAGRWANEASALFRDAGQTDLARWALAARLAAEGQRGDQGAADAIAAELDVRGEGTLTFRDADIDRGRAWHAVVRGDLAGARGILDAAAAAWTGVGAVTSTVAIAHDLARIGAGDDAVHVLGEVTVPSDWPFGTAVVRHATAASTSDAEGLEDAARRFDALGMHLAAAEAAAQSASAWRVASSARKAQRVAAWAAALAARCEGAHTPALARAGDAGALSPREHEAALLAAQGLTNRTIAERLGLAERTVENHLQRAYIKLGISARDELLAHLGTGPPSR